MGGVLDSMTLNELRELYNNGTLKKLYYSGYITAKPLMVVQFHNYKDAHKNTSKTEIVRDLSIIFDVSESTVWNYLRAV